MKDSFTESQDVVKQISETLTNAYKLDVESVRHIGTSIHPIISNAMHHRDNILIQSERFTTLINLARVLDDDNINKAIIALKYQLTKKQ